MMKVVPAIHAYKRKVLCMQRCIRHFLVRTREASAHNEAVWRAMEHKEIKLLMREKRKALQEQGGPVLGRPKLGGGRGDPESLSEDAIPHLVVDVEVMCSHNNVHSPVSVFASSRGEKPFIPSHNILRTCRCEVDMWLSFLQVMRKSLQHHIRNQRTKFMLKLGEYHIQVWAEPAFCTHNALCQ